MKLQLSARKMCPIIHLNLIFAALKKFEMFKALCLMTISFNTRVIKKFQWLKIIVSYLLIFIDATGRATWLYFKNIFHGDAAEEKYNALKPVLDEFAVGKTACIVNHGVTGLKIVLIWFFRLISFLT